MPLSPRRRRTACARSPRIAWICFVQLGAHGPIKIGRATNIRHRFSALSLEYPGLRLVYAYRALETEERALHERFDADRLGREWFHPSPTLLRHITQLWLAEDPEARAMQMEVRAVVAPGCGGTMRLADFGHGWACRA